MKNLTLKKSLSFIATAALLSLTVVSIPTAARASTPTCATAAGVTTCVGTTTDGAKYQFSAPLNFNGTAYIYSHGYRPNIALPVGAIPRVGGPVIDVAEPVPGGDLKVAAALLGKGFGIMGSGFSRQGWNADEAIKTNVELIGIFKKQFPATKKIIAWGNSLGGFITQALAEKHPELISAAGPMCVASHLPALVTMAGDALWGMKVLFDPAIKGGNYSAGAAGVAEALGDLQRGLTVLLSLQAALVANSATPAWPSTSTVPAQLKAVPSRSAAMMIALMSGVPLRSVSFDSASAPAVLPEDQRTSYQLAINPFLASLENLGYAIILGVLAMHDLEQRAGGAIFDNSKTNYTDRMAEARFVWNAGLSGNTAINGMLGYLAAAPRAKANPAALAKFQGMLSLTGKVNVPTVLFTGVEDPVTTAGNQQWLVDRYAEQYADEWAKNKKDRVRNRPTNLLLPIWNFAPDTYTKFGPTGLPVTAAGTTGTLHCNFTSEQVIAIAELLAYASANGEHLRGGALLTKLRKAKNMSFNRDYVAPALKYFGDN
jgi:pimeloyl-ACP methyl ester carboxylesterase